MFTATCLTLFPESFPGALGASVIGAAEKKQLWRLETLDMRQFSPHKHASVDAPPAGGGAGLVMRADVVAAALDALAHDGRQRLVMTPRGRPITQSRVRDWAMGPGVVVVCGRFEGIDQRVIDARGLEEVSVGDVVLAGGEVAAQLLIDACVRLIPGVLGSAASIGEESFEAGLLEYPQYTRPRVWEGREIPPVLLSGNHGDVARWRKVQSVEITAVRRPDLLTQAPEGAGVTKGEVT
jgi:tRNA (guanine37-N1)-methyltransferase